jgi:hypothetical protein
MSPTDLVISAELGRAFMEADLKYPKIAQKP